MPGVTAPFTITTKKEALSIGCWFRLFARIKDNNHAYVFPAILAFCIIDACILMQGIAYCALL